jgi:hypothetical protein
MNKKNRNNDTETITAIVGIDLGDKPSVELEILDRLTKKTRGCTDQPGPSEVLQEGEPT